MNFDNLMRYDNDRALSVYLVFLSSVITIQIIEWKTYIYCTWAADQLKKRSQKEKNSKV